jgi:uncharacterized membrane protein YdjX (TVP38/TMEM64 family)
VSRSAWVKAAALLGLAAAAWWLLRALGLDPLDLHPERIRSFIVSFGLWAPAAYFLLFGQPIVPLPASVIMIAAGLAFGPWWGLLAAVSGATLRASTQYLLARRLGRELISRLLHHRLMAINRFLTHRPFRSVLLVRLVPNFPFDIQNYSLGCSGVPFGPYVLATALGIVPASFGFVYFGHALTTPRSLWIAAAVLLVTVGFVWVQCDRRASGPIRSR